VGAVHSINRSLLNNRGIHRDVRYAPFATEIVRRCSMS